MSSASFQAIYNNTLTIHNIIDFAENNAIFNAGQISNIECEPDLASTGNPGDALIYNGFNFTPGICLFFNIKIFVSDLRKVKVFNEFNSL